MSRRAQIAMTQPEIEGFLQQQRVLVCATNGQSGWPHLMPLWFVTRNGDVWAWTYAKSQKVRNLERDPRATLQLEDGVEYQELHGVMIEAHTTIHRDTETVAQFGAELLARYSGGQAEHLIEAVRVQAAKRVALQFVAQRVASWDHRKLGGTY